MTLELDRLKRRIAGLEEIVKTSRHYHVVCDDSWYTCPKAILDNEHNVCANDEATEKGECNCGADSLNNRIDAMLKKLDEDT